MQCHFPPSYVLDEMEWYEIDAAVKYSFYSIKEQWEQARLISYLIVQTQSKKKISFEDIAKFPWDSQEMQTSRTKITNTDI